MRHTYFTVKSVGAGDVTSSLTSGVTEAAVAAMMPQIREMMVQEVLPMLMVGLIAGAAISSVIGSYFATRRPSGGIRRNPRRWRTTIRRRVA